MVLYTIAQCCGTAGALIALALGIASLYRSIQAASEIRELAHRHTTEAIKELARLAVKAKSENARIAAIRELLDRCSRPKMQGIRGYALNGYHLSLTVASLPPSDEQG